VQTPTGADGGRFHEDFDDCHSAISKRSRCRVGPGLLKIGNIYCHCDGVPRVYTQAKFYFEKAVAAGDVEAPHDIGHLHAYSLNGPVDDAQALSFFQKGSSAGSAIGMYIFAMQYQW
jgi:TPR repeat protein